MLDSTYAIQVERAEKEGKARPQPPTASDVARVRQVAWVEWIGLLIAIGGGLAVSAFGPRNKTAWATTIAMAVVVYVVCRWYFAPSSYSELFRTLFDQSARVSQSYLAREAPFGFAQLVYFNVVVPVALLVVAVVRLMRPQTH